MASGMASAALVLGTLALSVPAAIKQYRNDRTGFMATLRIMGVYAFYCAVAIGLMCGLMWLKGPASPGGAVAGTAFMLAWIFYGGVWLVRTVPRYTEVPASIDRRWSWLDYGFAAVMVVSLVLYLIL